MLCVMSVISVRLLGLTFLQLFLNLADASDVPTSMPTSMPTSIPSMIPSAMPSAAPSMVPSSLPSVTPSSVPTSMSSNYVCEPGQTTQRSADLQIHNTTENGEIVKYVISTPQHPYDNCTVYSTGTVGARFIQIPNADGYNFKFDNRTSSQFEHDYLTIHEGGIGGPILFHRSGVQGKKYPIETNTHETLYSFIYPWSFIKIASSKGLHIEFSTDSTISDWGISVTVNKSSVERKEPEINYASHTATLSIPPPYDDNTIYSFGPFNLENNPTSAAVVAATTEKTLRHGHHSTSTAPWYVINFGETNTEGGYDFIKIYENTSAGDLLYMRSGGYSTWPTVYLPSSSGLQVIFTTDAHKEGESDDHDPQIDITMTLEEIPDDSEPSGLNNRVYTISYNGVIYSTLADVPLDAPAENSQSFFMRLPSNWRLAEDNGDSRFVIQNHVWNTDYVVLEDGAAIGTKSTSDMAGKEFTGEDNMLVEGSNLGDYKCKNVVRCQILIVQDIPSSYTLFGFDDVEDVFRNMAIAFMVIFFVFSSLSYLHKKGYLKNLLYRGRYGGAHQPTSQHRWEAEEAIDNRHTTGDIPMNPLARNTNNASAMATVTASSPRIGNSINAWDTAGKDSNALNPSAVARADNSRARRDPFVAQAIQEGGFSPGPQPKNNSSVPKISIRPPKPPVDVSNAGHVPATASFGSSGVSSNSSAGGNLLDLPNSTSTRQTPASPTIAPAQSRSQKTLSREWTEKYSQQHKRKFWKNNITGKSTWEDPFKQNDTSSVLVSKDSQSSEPDLL